ncbi:MAG: class II fumarate hydratase [Candidatus Dadabacteria bacterium]|nr:MAG: class II fumarate hydratase [Candidatus Dadabacteria bacterium]
MRKERDSMGEMEVPDWALYGASTQRAVLNFPVSGITMPARFISALGVVKLCAAKANESLGLLESEKSEAIQEAASEVIDNKLDKHFVVDVFQTGSGTSSNMNANEVIANRAIQILGGQTGDRSLIHPNDHVNMSQSSNDVIPTAMHISACMAMKEELYPALNALAAALDNKADEFKNVVKSGRTHLQDATPITLGQEFSGYAAQIRNGIERIKNAEQHLQELALGGTAVGTGLNTHPEFSARAISEINKVTGLDFRETRNHFEAQGSRDAIVELSGQLKVIACSLMKIANDIRWLAAGPRCNLAEINLPEIQPGSSIMPGKVNPVICESVMMVCAQIIGFDSTITVCGQHGNLELNVMMPVMAYDILEALRILSAACNNFVSKCIVGITANEERCNDYAEKSLAVCTSLAPHIGYDTAAALAKRALKENKTVREMALAMKVLDEKELNRLLDLHSMTKPGL